MAHAQALMSAVPVVRARALAAYLILALGGGLLAFGIATTSYSLDLPIMHFIASRTLAGEVPYRDLWDMNGPAIYQIHILLSLVPGDDIRVLQGFAWIVTMAAMLAGWRLASGRGQAPASAALLMALFAAWMTAQSLHAMGQRDVIIAAMAMIALWLMLDGPAQTWRWALAGLLIGYAVGIKPTAALFAISAFAASLGLPGDRRSRLARAFGLVAGGVAGGLLWFGWLLAMGAVDDWWSTMSAFNGAAYINMARVPLPQLVLTTTIGVAALGAIALAVAAATRTQAGPPHAEMPADAAGPVYTRGELALLFAFLGCAAAAFLLQGKGWPYQMAPVWLFGLVALGAGLSRMTGPARLTPIATSAVAVVLGLQLAPSVQHVLGPVHVGFMAERALHAESMRYALLALPADMKVQPLDTTDGALQAMTEAGRASASPVLYDFWLFEGTGATQARARSALLEGLQTTPSAVLVTNQGWPRPDRPGFERLAEFPELERLLHDHYVLVAEGTHGWVGERLRYRLYAPAG